MKSQQTQKGPLRNGGNVEDEDGLFTVEDVRGLQLKQVRGSFRNEGGLTLMCLLSDGVEDNGQVLCCQEVDGKSPVLRGLESVSGNLKASSDVAFHEMKILQGDGWILSCGDGHVQSKIGNQVGVLSYLESVSAGDVNEAVGFGVKISNLSFQRSDLSLIEDAKEGSEDGSHRSKESSAPFLFQLLRDG